MASFDVAKLLNKITQDIPGINTVLKALAKWDVSALTDVPDGAMQATTDTNNRLTIKKKVSGSYTPVAKLMHDVDTVDGYHASTSATANAVAVRNSSGALPGNITGNAATSDTAVALATGTVVPVNQGGTGATTASAARSNLGLAGSADFTAHVATAASPSVSGHVALDALAADGTATAAPGGYGLGVFAPISTDLNTIVGTQFFRGGGTTANRPINISVYGIHIQYSTASAIQEAWTHETPPRKYTRRFHMGAWEDWSPSPNSITDNTNTTSSTIAASATAVKAVNDSAVHLTDAETVTGEKTFSAPPIIFNTNPSIVQKCPDMVAGTNPTSAVVYGGLLLRDRNNYNLGGLSFSHDPSGYRRCQISFANAAGTGRVWPLQVQVNADDTSYVVVPTPPDADASTKAATTAWVLAHSSAEQVGDLIASLATSRAGCLLMNGAAVSRTTYANLFALIGTVFGAGNGSTTFNLPDARGRTMQGANGNLMALLAAGLPNITGRVNIGALAGGSSGALYNVTTNAVERRTTDTSSNSGSVNIDASRSSSIYGASNTVQPPAIAVNYFIKY